MKKDKIKLIVEIVLFVGALCGITFFYYFGGDKVVEEETSDVKLVKVTEDNFKEEVLKSDKPVILEFSSNSCPPCITMISTMINIAKNNSDIKVASVNSDEDNTSKILEKYEINAFPTILIFKEGEVVKTFVGVTSEDALLKEIK